MAIQSENQIRLQCLTPPPIWGGRGGRGGQTLEPQLAVEPTTPIREEMRMPPDAAEKKHPLLSSIFGLAIPLVDESMLAARFHPNCATLWGFCGKHIHPLFINKASPSPLFLSADIFLLNYLLMMGVVYDDCSFCGHILKGPEKCQLCGREGNTTPRHPNTSNPSVERHWPRGR